LRPDLAACVLLMATPAWPAEEPFTQAEIARAIDSVKADPELGTEEKRKRLVWKEPKAARAPVSSSWWQGIADFFGWVAQLSQMLMWLLIAALLASLALVLWRLLGKARPVPGLRQDLAPTHVRDLDIRPESLPVDIGAAARRLWEAGEQRAALALLYRGLLSRLAHTFAVPVVDSSTEGDCLALATRVLDARRLEFVAQLIRTWQTAIYAGRPIEDELVFELCASFDRHLPPATAAGDSEALPAGARA
jgi:hypothetical protein